MKDCFYRYVAKKNLNYLFEHCGLHHHKQKRKEKKRSSRPRLTKESDKAVLWNRKLTASHINAGKKKKREKESEKEESVPSKVKWRYQTTEML